MASRKKVEVHLSERANLDLHAIYGYLSGHSFKALGAFDKKLFSILHRLESFPNHGRWVPEFRSKKYREVFIDDYRVIYRYDESKKKIFILTIRHGKRFLPTVL